LGGVSPAAPPPPPATEAALPAAPVSLALPPSPAKADPAAAAAAFAAAAAAAAAEAEMRRRQRKGREPRRVQPASESASPSNEADQPEDLSTPVKNKDGEKENSGDPSPKSASPEGAENKRPKMEGGEPEAGLA